jgi:hypothetical protein
VAVELQTKLKGETYDSQQTQPKPCNVYPKSS